MELKDTVNSTINFLFENYRMFCNDLLDIGKGLRPQIAEYCINFI